MLCKGERRRARLIFDLFCFAMREDALVLQDKFAAVSARIWRATVAADVDPQLSHIELMFGSGSAPWNGKTQRQVTYYLSSHRTGEFVLLSFNACMAMCTDEFPRCYRVTYAKTLTDAPTAANKSERSADLRDDSSIVEDHPENRIVRQCGRSFPKSLCGVETALRMAHYAHLISLAKERQQWATLVEYAADGSFRILETWADVGLFMPTARIDVLRREIAACAPDYSFLFGNGLWSVLVKLTIGILILLFVLVLIGVITSAVRRHQIFSPRQKRGRVDALNFGLINKKRDGLTR